MDRYTSICSLEYKQFENPWTDTLALVMYCSVRAIAMGEPRDLRVPSSFVVMYTQQWWCTYIHKYFPQWELDLTPASTH